MLRRVPTVVSTLVLVSALVGASPASAQTLGLSIDRTQGLPGDVVNGQVNPADVAASCTTDLAEFQAKFQEVLAGPYGGGNPGSELLSRFFPGDDFVFENCDQAAFSLTGLVIFGIALNFNGAAGTACRKPSFSPSPTS